MKSLWWYNYFIQIAEKHIAKEFMESSFDCLSDSRCIQTNSAMVRGHNHNNIATAGPRLNIKTVLSTYGDFHVKDKTS